MAVTTFARTHARAPVAAAALPAGALVATLLAPALDLLRVLQASVPLEGSAIVAAACASLVLVAFWVRYPRTGWLAAGALAAVASLAMRLAGTELGPGLSLLAVLALGTGGAFASPTGELEALLRFSPVSPDGSSDAAPRPAVERHVPPKAA